MSSKTDLVNSAFIKLGEATVSNVDTDPNTPARVMKAQYDLKRRELLRKYQWNFAIKRSSLAPDATSPAFGYANRFLVPTDCIKFLGVYDESDPGYQVNYSGSRTPHKLEGGFILADDNPLNVFFVRDVTDVSLFDPMFFEALAWKLAIECGLAITNDGDRVAAAVAGYKDIIKDAKSADAMEGTPEVLMATEWLDSRLGYTGGANRGGPWV
jgi:hypothetical protein